MTRRLSRRGDLDGSAPDASAVVLLMIDTINDFTFEGAGEVLASARPMADRLCRLKRLGRAAGIPARCT